MYSPAQRQSIINHVFLPPQLPQAQEECDIYLVDVTLEGLRLYRGLSNDQGQAIDDSIGALERLRVIHSLAGGGTSEDEQRSVLGGFSKGQFFAVRVRRRMPLHLADGEGKLIFEAGRYSTPRPILRAH